VLLRIFDILQSRSKLYSASDHLTESTMGLIKLGIVLYGLHLITSVFF